MLLNMKVVYILLMGILAIFSLPSYENGIIDEPELEPESGITINYYRDGGIWNTLISGSVGHSYLGNDNIIVGFDIIRMLVPYEGRGMSYNMRIFGIDYQQQINDNTSQSIIRLNYSYFSYIFYFGAGVGMSALYNITNNDIGITPTIGGSLFFGMVKINYYYRYNVVFTKINNSYHETLLLLSINVHIE